MLERAIYYKLRGGYGISSELSAQLVSIHDDAVNSVMNRSENSHFWMKFPIFF